MRPLRLFCEKFFVIEKLFFPATIAKEPQRAAKKFQLHYNSLNTYPVIYSIYLLKGANLKRFIYRFLILCSGSDEDILKTCPRSEHIKHAGFGALVLVPAMLALFSMTYAISTFVDNTYLYITAGLIWCLIVFIFDRFVVSTFRKKETIKQDAASFAFISRLVFSLFVGIAVAHPLILLYFQESINVNMDETAHAKIDSIEHVYKIEKAAYQLQIDTVDNNLVPIRNEIKSWEGIVHDEVINSVRDEARGISGIPGHGPTFRNDTATIARLYLRLEETKKANALNKVNDSLQIVRLDSTLREKIRRLTFSRDYLEREKALARITDANPIISITSWFMILFFILVDILPVTWKALTKKGPYDDRLNLLELEVSNETEAGKIDSDTKLRNHRLRKEREVVEAEIV